MRLKYYLRGLGMGILATILILGLRNDTATAMSDEAVIARAKELGMIENTRFLSELQVEDLPTQTENAEETAEETTEATTEHATEETETAATETETVETEAVETEAAETETEETETQTTEEQNEETDETIASETESSEVEETEVPNDIIYSDAPVRLEIKSGSSSYTVCKDLEAAGLIRDAGKFDQYLISNGYSTSIRVGIYELLPGTAEKDIARIITGK